MPKMSDYARIYAEWQKNPVVFWEEQAKNLHWEKHPKTTFDANLGAYGRWFVDGECNTCYNAVDRHVENGRGAQNAIIYDSPMAGEKKHITYSQLQEEVATLAAVLQDLHVHELGLFTRLFLVASPQKNSPRALRTPSQNSLWQLLAG
jgi:propionyl-CoA synthetase